jgi:hypothetical protein
MMVDGTLQSTRYEYATNLVLRIRIRKFFGLLDPEVRGTDPDPDPSIIKQK